MRADRAGELRCIAEVRRDVGEVLHRVRVVALAQEGLRHPALVSREGVKQFPALAHGAAQVGEALVLVRSVAGVVPADVVEELMTRRKLDLTEPFVRLDTRRELDLVPVAVEAASAAGVRPDDPAAGGERPHVLGKAAQRTLDELLARCHIDVAALLPPRPAHRRERLRGEPLSQDEHRARPGHERDDRCVSGVQH